MEISPPRRTAERERRQKKNPREVANAIVETMRARRPVATAADDSVEVAGPGFINFRLAPAARQQVVQACSVSGQVSALTSIRTPGMSVMVEFVSANPTGPLHLGHARQAALGDALGNLLAAQGWQVTREFYYNDAGVQIANLALSVQARAKERSASPSIFPKAVIAANTLQRSRAIIWRTQRSSGPAHGHRERRCE